MVKEGFAQKVIGAENDVDYWNVPFYDEREREKNNNKAINQKAVVTATVQTMARR